MQTPVEIDFQGMRGRPEVQASIEHHVAELEQRYGRVTACRVVLKGPGGHHRTGGLYEVNIRLALPNGRHGLSLSETHARIYWWCSPPKKLARPTSDRRSGRRGGLARPSAVISGCGPRCNIFDTSVATRMRLSVDGQSIRRSDAWLHPATEAHDDCVARSGIHTTAETRSSGPGTDPSMRCRRHDCEGGSSSPATAVAVSSPCTLRPWSVRH